jgi:hypothetical protein
MDRVGPPLEVLTRHLAECPVEFYQPPIEMGSHAPRDPAAVDVVAIVSDHLRDLQMDLDCLRTLGRRLAQADIRHQRLAAITTWLLREDWFLAQSQLADSIGRLLIEGLRDLAATISPELTVTDADRREELVRMVLAALGLRPEGETVQQASDRLKALDSVERVRVITQTRAAEARARQIRQEMARRRAEEAAARYSPE